MCKPTPRLCCSFVSPNPAMVRSIIISQSCGASTVPFLAPLRKLRSCPRPGARQQFPAQHEANTDATSSASISKTTMAGHLALMEVKTKARRPKSKTWQTATVPPRNPSDRHTPEANPPGPSRRPIKAPLTKPSGYSAFSNGSLETCAKKQVLLRRRTTNETREQSCRSIRTKCKLRAVRASISRGPNAEASPDAATKQLRPPRPQTTSAKEEQS